jgi:hypothetical protein
MEIQVKIKFSGEMLGNLLVNALEGGSNYWYGSVDFIGRDEYPDLRYDEWFAKCVDDGIPFEIRITEEPWCKPHVLDLASVTTGTMAFVEEETRHYDDFVNGNDDAITADVWLQLCLFGEVVYG